MPVRERVNAAAVSDPSVTAPALAEIDTVLSKTTVDTVSESDHAPSPSSFAARTCTWYSVPWWSESMVAEVPATSWGPGVKAPLAP